MSGGHPLPHLFSPRPEDGCWPRWEIDVYESLLRQWSTTDEATGLETVSHHRGDRRAFLRRCAAVIKKALQEGPAGVRKLAPYLLGWVADPRTIRCAWDDLARAGGQAPGPNGHRYHELDDHEVWALCRCLGGHSARAPTAPAPSGLSGSPRGWVAVSGP